LCHISLNRTTYRSCPITDILYSQAKESPIDAASTPIDIKFRRRTSLFAAKSEEGIRDLETTKPLTVLEIFSKEDVTPRLDCGRDDQ